MQRRRISFNGRVQGVGFRATTRWIASGFPVSGWVRNEADGSVLMEVQGSAEAIDGCLGKLRERMAGCITTEAAAGMNVIEGEQGFEIRR
jgi:acylphosphatase